MKDCLNAFLLFTSKIFGIIAGISVGIAIPISIFLGVYWLVWTAWCWVVQQIYPSGPVAFIHPDFWLFLVVLLLINLLVRQGSDGHNKKS